MRSEQQNLMLHVLLIALLGLVIMGNTNHNHTFFAMSASKPTKTLLKIVAVVAAAVMLNRVEYVQNKRDEVRTYVKGQVKDKIENVKGQVKDKAEEVVNQLTEKAKDVVSTNVQKVWPMLQDFAIKEGKKAGKKALHNKIKNINTIKGIWDLNQKYKMAMGVGAMGVGAARAAGSSVSRTARDAYEGAKDAEKTYKKWAVKAYSPTDEERVEWVSTTLGTVPEFVSDVPTMVGQNIMGQNTGTGWYGLGLENGATGPGWFGLGF